MTTEWAAMLTMLCGSAGTEFDADGIYRFLGVTFQPDQPGHTLQQISRTLVNSQKNPEVRDAKNANAVMKVGHSESDLAIALSHHLCRNSAW